MNASFGQRPLNVEAADYASMVFVISQFIGRMVTIVPVQVMAVTRTGTLTGCAYVSVQPLLNQMTGNEQGVPHGVISNMPAWRMQAGTAAVILDPVVGDVGAMLCAYRDSSPLVAADEASPGSLQSGSTTFNPGSAAQYDWGSGLYLGGWFNGTASQYFHLTESLCKVVWPTINLNGLTIDSSGNLDTSGSVTSNGTVLHTHEHLAGTSLIAPSGGGEVTGQTGAPA